MSDTTPPRRALTARQRRFVAEYAIDRNGTAAVFRAFGPTTRDGRRRTDRGARMAAARMLANANIRAAVEATIRGHARACRISAARVLRELAMIAFADIGDLLEADPDRPGMSRLRPLATMPPAARRALVSVRVKRTRVREEVRGEVKLTISTEEVEYKLGSKLEALEQLCRYLGLTRPGAALEALLAMMEAERVGCANLHTLSTRSQAPEPSATGTRR